MNKNASVAQALNDLTTDRNLLARDLKIAQQRIAELEAKVARLEKELEPLEGRSALDHMRYQSHLEAKAGRMEAIREAALEYVTDSYRPTPKYDAARFDRLCEALGYKHCGTQSGDDLIEED